MDVRGLETSSSYTWYRSPWWPLMVVTNLGVQSKTFRTYDRSLWNTIQFSTIRFSTIKTHMKYAAWYVWFKPIKSCAFDTKVCLKRWNNILWRSMVSKTAERSSIIKKAGWLLSRARLVSFLTWRRAVSVLCRTLYADWNTYGDYYHPRARQPASSLPFRLPCLWNLCWTQNCNLKVHSCQNWPFFNDRIYHSLFQNMWENTASKRLIDNTGYGTHHNNNVVFSHPGCEAVKWTRYVCTSLNNFNTIFII